MFREDINDEIEHLSNFLLLKISRVVDFIIRSSCNCYNLGELASKVEQKSSLGKMKAFANR